MKKIPLGFAILTVSTTRTLIEDKSGDYLEKAILADGHKLINRSLVKDNHEAIQEFIEDCLSDKNIHVILTTGGTGLTGSDGTPEAVMPFFTKDIPGFGELFRMLSYDVIGTSTIQSRAVGGLAGDTFIFSLPGSTGACKDAWTKILTFQCDSNFKPCNFVELLPRLLE